MACEIFERKYIDASFQTVNRTKIMVKSKKYDLKRFHWIFTSTEISK